MATDNGNTVYTLTVINARGEDKNLKNLVITNNAKDKDYQIIRLSYEKRLYSPCCINVELKRVKNTLGLSNIKKDFGGKSVTLQVSAGSKNSTIATDYFVYHYNPVFAGSTCSVFLTLYSRDKLLTLNKFNKVYLNKKLGADIITKTLCTVGTEVGPLTGCKVTPDIQNLQLLTYSISNKEYEVLQPYRVQYNEDFYSFISRIACRCGEFLYFEDGKLKLGLDNSEAIEIKTSDTLRMEYPGFGNSPLAVSSCFRDYFINDTTYSENSLTCSDYGAFDEYFDVLDKGKLPDKWGDEFYLPDLLNWIKDSVLPFVGTIRGHEIYTSAEKITEAALEFVTMFSSYGTNAKYVNDKFKKFFDTSDSQRTDGDKLSQFADVRRAGYGRLLNKQLAEIRDKEMEAAREVVRIRVETGFSAEKKIKLGSRVSIIEGENKTEYRVVSCTGQYSETQIKDGNKIDGSPNYILKITDITDFELVPLRKILLYTSSDNKGILSGSPLCIPPYDKCAESVPAPPQIAVVTEDNDPRYIGRVRVRYTWQKKDDPGSPWVRVLAPLASSSGAVHFQPKEGDEVMLGYIDGNIDRPYVAGSLFNDKGKLHDCLYSAYNNTIRVGSQRLDFRTGSIANWFDSVIPFASMVTPFIQGQMNDLTKKADDTGSFAKNLHGITRLTDAYEIWKIEGNTAARTVTINSAWGKVKIDAYTGVTIESAGDISIKGRNISISAQDKIKIESGVAIKNARKSQTEYNDRKNNKTDTFLAGLGWTFVDLGGKKLDLSLPRVIFDSINPPKDGTLEIKSNRYLLLEAGRGAAYDSVSTATNRLNRSESCLNELVAIIGASEDYVDLKLGIHSKKLTNVQETINKLIDSIKPKNIQNNEVNKFVREGMNDKKSIDDTSLVKEMKENDVGEQDKSKKDINEIQHTDVVQYIYKENVVANLDQLFTEISNEKVKYEGPLKEKYDKAIKDAYSKCCKKHPTVDRGLYKNYVVRTMIGKYINDIDFLTMDVNPDAEDWLECVESIQADKNVIRDWYLESTSWKSGYQTPFYIDAKNLNQGSILMSQKDGHSIMLDGKTFTEVKNTENEEKNLATFINNLKKIINKCYPEPYNEILEVENRELIREESDD